MLVRVRAAILLWWAARYGLIRQLSPSRRLAAADRAVALWRGAGTSTSHGLADALVVLGQCLIRVGRAAEAEAAGREAVAIYGDACRLGRADAYHMLAQALVGLDRLDDARAAAESAVAGYRPHAGQRSVRRTARLAATLYTQGLILAQMDRHDEALQVREESVQLTYAVPLLYRGRTLRIRWRAQCHLAGSLWRAGRYEEALRVGGDGLEFIDILVLFSPAFVRPYRAELLAHLARCHGQLGHLNQAAATAEKAVADYRELGEAYQAGTAWALEIHADRLTALDRHGDADMARREAAEIYTSLARAEPDRYREPLYRAVGNRADELWASGERDAAVAVNIGFLPVLRTFATADPATYEPLLANCLAVLAGRASLLGRDDALEHADQALGLARQLAEDGSHDRLQARCLHNRALVLKRIRRFVEAAAAAQEAVIVRRRMADAEPAIYETDLAASLSLLASILYALDRDEEAAAQGTEAAEILRRHAEDPAHGEQLADVLHDVALAHSAVHQHRKAIDTMGESIEHRRRLLDPERQAQVANLAIALRQRSFDLSAIGRDDEARAHIEEAIEIFRVLAIAAPDRFQHEVAQSVSQAVRQQAKTSGEDPLTHSK